MATPFLERLEELLDVSETAIQTKTLTVLFRWPKSSPNSSPIAL